MEGLNKSRIDNLRGNQDIFLGYLRCSKEFENIQNKHIHNNERTSLGIAILLGKASNNNDFAKNIDACADEVSSHFRIKKDIAKRLLLSSKHILPINMNYSPKISNDGEYVYLRLSAKTTQADIKSIWNLIKTEQRKIGKVGSKASINSELAFCIHRQYAVKGRKMTEVFNDYRMQQLEGFNHPPTIEYEDEFRKYYKKVVKGLLI